MKLWTESITLSLLKKGNLDIDTLVSGWIGYTDTQKILIRHNIALTSQNCNCF